MVNTITREQWMLAHALAGVIKACNAPFCYRSFEEQEEINNDPDYIDNVAAELANQCSQTMLEDVAILINRAIETKNV